MKTIYLVRHGESEGNKTDTVQSSDTPLTDKGVSQAEQIAQRCTNLGAQQLLCSTDLRAKQTAEIISQKTGLTPSHSDLLVERRQPSKHHGRSHQIPEVAADYELWWENFGKPGFKLHDAESFEDLRIRGQQALELLQSQPEDVLLVVTHGHFLRILMASILFGKQLTAPECLRIVRGFRSTNTGLSKFIYDDDRHPHPWSVSIWNDSSHLGE